MRLLFVLLAVLATAACGGSGERAGDDQGVSPPASGTPGPGGGLSIEEALASDAEGPLTVKGALVATGREVRLCSALLESFPPQCGEPSLLVEGLDLEEVEGLQSERDVSWTDKPLSLLGTVENGVLTVGKTAL